MNKYLNFIGVIIFLISYTKTTKCQTVTDYDGNIYNVVSIGSQEWLKENLRTTRYGNGDTITNVVGKAAWANLAEGGWAYYNNDTNYNIPYGKLYNWLAVIDNRKVCPIGWHVPSLDEWEEMIDYVGGTGYAGGAMKVTDTLYWKSPNTGATNSSGFSSVPSAYRSSNGDFNFIGYGASYWSSAEDSTTQAWSLAVYSNDAAILWGHNSKFSGQSIRCMKDLVNKVNDNTLIKSFTIYPNPANKVLHITCSEQVARVEIYNMLGELVLEKTGEVNTIPVDVLAQGVYTISIKTITGKTAVSRFTKQ